MNLGVLALRMADLQRADECLNQALSAHDAIGNRHGMAFTLGNLSSLHLDAGDLDQALSYARRALRLSQELGDGVALTRFFNYRARIHARRGEAELAQEALDQSLAFADQLDDDVLRAFQQVASAWVAHDARDWERVDACLLKAELLAAEQPEDGVIHTDIKAVRSASRD
jgi:tetratricopeptide (TPR) repeat protein